MQCSGTGYPYGAGDRILIYVDLLFIKNEVIDIKEQIIISISREFGSGGGEIARALATQLQLPFCDKCLLEHIAQEHGIDVELLKRYDEVPRNVFTSRNVKGFVNSPAEQVAQMQFQYLRQIAQQGTSFVVLGRCAEEILKDEPSLVSIFVRANTRFKKERTIQLYDFGEEAALERMEKMDRRRKYYHNQYCRGKWGDSRNYDLVIDSSKLGIPKTVDFLTQYISMRKENAVLQCE